MNDLLAARSQMGMSLAFHIIFAVIGIGMPLLMLVAAFAGRERVLAAYREAVSRRYRFYSYGDSSLLLPER